MKKLAAFLISLFAPVSAFASFLSGEAVDAAATVIAWLVIVFVPVVLIYLFWMVHILPEKIAEKNHHPQKDVIKTLCLLSLVFGGLLWPFAWLWAYTKPVAFRMAYGTDKHADYYTEAAEQALKGEMSPEELDHLRDELDLLAEKNQLTPALKRVRKKLAGLEPPAAVAR